MKTRDAFTLIELLVVIAIIAVLISFATLGVTSLGSASRLNQAGNLFVDAVNQTRQTARTNNTLVLLVVAKDADGDLRLFTLCEGAADSSEWRQITRWMSLPEGIVIDESQSQLEAQAITPALPTLKQNGRTLTSADYSYQAFLPDGRLLADSNPIFCIVAPTAPDNFYRIVVNLTTGIPIIERP